MDNNSISSWIEDKRGKHGSLVKLPELIPSLLDDLEEKAKTFEFAESKKSFKLRTRLDFHPIIKNEHLWERFITQTLCNDALLKNTFFNQFSLTGTNNIDLLKTDKSGQITHIIELKTGSNEIGHAAYELVFYYFLLLRAKDKSLIKYKLAEPMNLIILAPKYYYKTDYQQDFLIKMRENLNKDEYNKANIDFISLPESNDRDEMKSTTEKIRSKIIGKEIPNDALTDLRESLKESLKKYF